MEHDPTMGAGPETTGNEHQPQSAAPETSTEFAHDVAPPADAQPPAHVVVRGRRLEGTCTRLGSHPARPREDL